MNRTLTRTTALTALLLAAALAAPARADEPRERAALDACVSAHATPADVSTMRRLMVLTMLRSADNAEEFGTLLSQTKYEQIIDGVGQLLTRLVKQDCPAEVRAYASVSPSGTAFGALVGALNAKTQAAIGPDLVRAGATAGIDIIRKMDAATLVDVGSAARVANGAPPPSAPPPDGPKKIVKSAVAGVPLRLDFVTALNPDCTLIGKTVIRVTAKPNHGTARVEDGTGYSSFDAKNQRYHCNEQKTNGELVWYTPAKDYTGPDSISYEIIYPTGNKSATTVDITVN